MAEGKWITDIEATTPLIDAARRVLTVRFQVVHDHLPLAAHHWKDDAEHVHQLRVGSRRAGAALAIFSLCLPEKTFSRMRAHLRKLRRAAGAARDWDVFSHELAQREQQVTVTQRPGLDFLLGYCQAQRVEAQCELTKVAAGAPFVFERVAAKAVAAVRKAGGKQRKLHLLGDLAKPWLSKAVGQLHAAGAGNLDQFEQLHQVRIRGKRLRYGMEVFAPCFTEEFRTRFYPMVEEMQEILGLANDSQVGCQRLADLTDVVRTSQPALWKRVRLGIEGLLRFHQQRLVEQRGLFIEWYSRWQQSGADAALTGLVQAPP